ncbi:MAG: glycyl-radical enzyme activating protein [Treponema sp.]|nr:glycyl-radical enzyme activating protein [Treponema sp.]
MTEPPTEKITSGSEFPSACIFDIQSFSIHDGPGTRTTIFFKGCPQNCVWCHNPESKNKNPQIMFFKNNCTGCMSCVDACKNGAQIISPCLAHDMLHDKCSLCGKCLEVCCYDALKLCGQPFTSGALLEKIKSDIPYITEHGGITFSGGEPLLYADFIKDFCVLLPAVRTAMETSGYGSKEAIKKIIDCIDLFLFDIKILNSAEHKIYCGQENEIILSNLEYIYEKGKTIILRLPLVPGINDTPQHFDAVLNLVNKYPNIKNIQIMPYNNYGLSKIEALGLNIPEALPRLNPSKETKYRWLEEFLKRGLTNVICN